MSELKNGKVIAGETQGGAASEQPTSEVRPLVPDPNIVVVKARGSSDRVLITEGHIREAARRGKLVRYRGIPILTPSARDLIDELGVRLEPMDIRDDTERGKATPSSKSIVIGADHRGYALKEAVKKYLMSKGFTVEDVGTHNVESCDFPDFAEKLARIVARGDAQFGVFIDSTGGPGAMVCNKIKGVRAYTIYDELSARSARQHGDANIACIGADTTAETKAMALLDIWLSTPFDGGEKYVRRVQKVRTIEEG